jgi:hypothetical protein
MSNRHALAISVKSEAAQPAMAIFPPQSAIFASIGVHGIYQAVRDPSWKDPQHSFRSLL